MIIKKINTDKLKYDILYRCLCNFIKSRADKTNGVLSPKELNLIIGSWYHVPKDMRGYLIAELIEINFFEVIKEGKGNSYKYKVLI